ncbi:MAG: aspartate aminotransferase family protein, partial [Gammaproteobacteria bacterium]|nr:aspartate aminotransferase family protein [Gammaproteobacteria bacterium]
MTAPTDRALLDEALRRAIRYLDGIDARSVGADPAALEGLARLGGPLPDDGAAPIDVLALLDEAGSPATVACAGGRYFGFVTGGVLPAALAAGWLASAWDQNAFSTVSSPVGAAIEAIALEWLLDALALPPESGGAFVTGAT